MSTRTTKKEINAVVKHFSDFMGIPLATSYNDVGCMQLDYNSVYGGYMLNVIHNTSGGVAIPFGDSRYPANQFVAMLRFAISAKAMYSNRLYSKTRN